MRAGNRQATPPGATIQQPVAETAPDLRPASNLRATAPAGAGQGSVGELASNPQAMTSAGAGRRSVAEPASNPQATAPRGSGGRPVAESAPHFTTTPAPNTLPTALPDPERSPGVTSGTDRQPELLLRVEKGEPDPVELAALAAVLRLRSGGEARSESAPRRAARWRRPERVTGFAGARTWRN
jgi:hypothetical protein